MNNKLMNAEMLIMEIKRYGRTRRDDERYKEQGFDLEADSCLEEIIESIKAIYELALPESKSRQDVKKEL